MKKLLTLFGISLLALVLAVPAFAADKPIEVYINGSEVSFPAGSPYIKNNSVMVPFRVIFEELGLEVLWDANTGTVTGTSADLSISLKIGSTRATVNGTVKKLTAAPVSTGGTTYIPLRFIAEATGGTTVWAADTRSVEINTPEPSASDEAEIAAVIALAMQYCNEERAISFYSLMSSESDNADAVSNLNSFFQAYDFSDTINTLKVLNIQGDEATAYTLETSIWKGGYYYPDEKNEYLYSLVRTDGKWKISDVQLQKQTILLTREQGMTAAANVPQGDASNIKDQLSKYHEFLSTENVEGTLSMLSVFNSDTDADGKTALQSLFNSLDLRYTLDNSNIYYFTSDEAAVYTETTIKEAASGNSYKQTKIYIMSKADNGTWTIDNSFEISTEELKG
ncbi:stalk domain-containing protein [Paenibacillus sp. S150]|uniref:stalk domain-containing protein n=1 Tax=Paenibacillus sp. S150 TaxID=2749826 RepID=UPI001C59778D|nr:stalk domain-containing protein [Paenibacillus sp. S150]MBW4080925.1 copper amine oxidase N-terminal domain-containing protein [Paenibacillus sp. S150]